MTIPNSRPPRSIGVSRKRPASSPIGTPTTSATRNAATVSSTVAAPFSTMIEVTVRLSVRRRPEVERDDVAEVLDVLLDDRLVEAGRLAALLELLLRQPPAERRLIGSPGATRISRKTIVSRIRTVGIASASRVSA